MTRGKLTWEMVNQSAMHKYCNADPRVYDNVTQIVPNDQIPDEDWHVVERESDLADLEEQYRTLKRWSETGDEPIRNVRLYRSEEPQWVEI